MLVLFALLRPSLAGECPVFDPKLRSEQQGGQASLDFNSRCAQWRDRSAAVTRVPSPRLHGYQGFRPLG